MEKLEEQREADFMNNFKNPETGKQYWGYLCSLKLTAYDNWENLRERLKSEEFKTFLRGKNGQRRQW